ncbi:hypothetical protein Tco_0859104 [Tanacetum coccineum]|uniref:Uncharacterized protein n=1 Tax=Tanacetum coccineum TaxID=301880 RepID=A0ABQ5BD94_9ASTR
MGSLQKDEDDDEIFQSGRSNLVDLQEKLNRTGDTVAMEPACKSNGTGDTPMEPATIHPNQEKSFVIFKDYG